jgi:uncharacterized protein
MRITTITIVALAGLTACEWNSDNARIDASTQPRPDGRNTTDPDGDIEPDMDTSVAAHLLLSEVALTPTGAEFIEITNPNATDVSLADYYLSDSGEYWKLPGGIPTINASDFIVEFPMTATIAGGASITVAIGSAALFNTAYGMMPTYSVVDGTVTKTAVPGTATMTDTGEIVVLFHWDGAAGLVEDVDMMLAGKPTAANGITTKSGVTLGASTYATDANTIQVQTATPGSGVSTKRTMAEAGHETQAGTGNGIDGDDETSEDTRTTWDSTFTAPTPNAAPAF